MRNRSTRWRPRCRSVIELPATSSTSATWVIDPAGLFRLRVVSRKNARSPGSGVATSRPTERSACERERAGASGIRSPAPP